MNQAMLKSEWDEVSSEILLDRDDGILDGINVMLVSEEYPPFTPWWIATYQKTLAWMLTHRNEVSSVAVVCRAEWEADEWVSLEDWIKVIRIKPYFEDIQFLADTLW